MSHITKVFTATCGVQAEHHELVVRSVKIDADGVYSFPDLQLHAYHDKLVFDAGAKQVDCFRPVTAFSITRAERDQETGTDDERVRKAILKKITSSTLDGNSNETNLWAGNAGTIDYVGCGIQV